MQTLAQWLFELTDAVAASGALGVWVFVGAYALGTLVFVPRTGFNVSAGWLFGVGAGFAVAFGASLLAALAAWALGARWLRDFAQRLGAKYASARGLARVSRAHPIRLAALWHLALVLPFSAINWYLGALRTPWRPFVLGKVIGVIPGTLLYVWIGATTRDLAAALAGQGAQSPAVTIAMVAGLAIAAGTIVWIAVAARKALVEDGVL